MGSFFKIRLFEYITECIKECEAHKVDHGFHEGLEPYLDGQIVAFQKVVEFINENKTI